ncbi:hypothetical protein E2C01_028199 [Portunus trituberculatus]|uniref:Uncharacterized protein n=1 Tax=Portunus trituberculatus TaxID=210409 RepID=A0A5B7ENP8_PORTR|nr:hypothetical protein [Portunus trituberculatus]
MTDTYYYTCLGDTTTANSSSSTRIARLRHGAESPPAGRAPRRTPLQTRFVILVFAACKAWREAAEAQTHRRRCKRGQKSKAVRDERHGLIGFRRRNNGTKDRRQRRKRLSDCFKAPQQRSALSVEYQGYEHIKASRSHLSLSRQARHGMGRKWMEGSIHAIMHSTSLVMACHGTSAGKVMPHATGLT